MISNTFRIMKRNLGNIWKILLYKIVVIILIAALAYSIMLPIILDLNKTTFFTSLAEAFKSLSINFNLHKAGRALGASWKLFVDVLEKNIGYFSLVTLTLIAVFGLGKIILKLSDLPFTNIIDKKMSQMQRVRFVPSFTAGFRQSVILQLIRVIIVLPIDLLLGWALIALANSSMWGNTSIAVVLPIILFFALVVFSIRIYFFCGLFNGMVSDGLGIFASIKQSFKNAIKMGFKGYFTTMLFVGALSIITVGLMLPTMGISLIFTIPLVNLAVLIYYNVFYYTATKKKYYINSSIYVCPAEEVLAAGIGGNLTGIDVIIDKQEIKKELKELEGNN